MSSEKPSFHVPNEDTSLRINVKTLLAIVTVVSVVTFFYVTVQITLASHADAIVRIDRRFEKQDAETADFRREITLKIDYLVGGRRGPEPEINKKP